MPTLDIAYHNAKQLQAMFAPEKQAPDPKELHAVINRIVAGLEKLLMERMPKEVVPETVTTAGMDKPPKPTLKSITHKGVHRVQTPKKS